MTTSELVELVFDRGGDLWTVEGNAEAEVTVRHKGAPKGVIQALRSVPIDDVVSAIEERRRKIQTALEWFFENLMPVTAASTSLKSLIHDYLEYAHARQCGDDLRHVKQILRPHEVDGGMVAGFMLLSDFVEIVHRQRMNVNRFQVGDVIRCDHYTGYPRLIVLEIRAGDLMVSAPSSSRVFWVGALDCELVEGVEERIGTLTEKMQ